MAGRPNDLPPKQFSEYLTRIGKTANACRSLASPAKRFTVVYNACVLYPAPLRDLLMRLALTDLFRARWSEQIHDEWINAVLRNRPDLSRQQLERTARS